jgi:hypothetical protein
MFESSTVNSEAVAPKDPEIPARPSILRDRQKEVGVQYDDIDDHSPGIQRNALRKGRR